MMGEPNEATIRFYCPRGNYQKIQTSYSSRIETPRFALCWGSNYTGEGLLRIIHGVRAHVKKRVAEGVVQKVDWVPRFSRTARWRKNVDSCEVDLSSAYASAALKIGALELKMYDRLMTYHKKTRLIAVGSLGTKRRVSTFRKGKMVDTVEEIQETRWVWDSVVAEVDRTMCELMESAGGDFLHYWTDAIFVKKGAEARIQEKAKSLGYKTKKVYLLCNLIDGAFKTSDGRKFPIMGMTGAT